MDRYYPTPFLNNSPKTDKTTENPTENRNTLLMTHYPSDYLPSPENRWDSLSPYLPDLSRIDPLSAKLSHFFPEKAKFDRQERLRRLNRPDPTPDESTSFTYSSDNNLTHADLPDGSDLDFAYDAAGRRLEKKYTKVINNVTYETKYTYHYIGSQITTIDIQGKEDETVVKNDQIRIHLGANSRPISFEYYTDIGTEQEASETYYYHYDLHGNVIRVTDDAGATEITYAYDALGTIVSETNTNSIYNPFTWSGEAQVIHDPEFNTTASSPITGLYNSGSGYYNPETGTFLSGTGAPADVNPTSTRHEDVSAMLSRPMEQQLGSTLSSTQGGLTVGAKYAPSTSVAPEDPYEGMDKAGMIRIESEELKISIHDPNDPRFKRDPGCLDKRWVSSEYDENYIMGGTFNPLPPGDIMPPPPLPKPIFGGGGFRVEPGPYSGGDPDLARSNARSDDLTVDLTSSVLAHQNDCVVVETPPECRDPEQVLPCDYTPEMVAEEGGNCSFTNSSQLLFSNQDNDSETLNSKKKAKKWRTKEEYLKELAEKEKMINEVLEEIKLYYSYYWDKLTEQQKQDIIDAITIICNVGWDQIRSDLKRQMSNAASELMQKMLSGDKSVVEVFMNGTLLTIGFTKTGRLVYMVSHYWHTRCGINSSRKDERDNQESVIIRDCRWIDLGERGVIRTSF